MLSPSGSQPDPEDPEEETPLDPAVERVQARLKRLMLVSGLTTLIGFAAVAVAIFYRLSATDNPETSASAQRATDTESAGLPAELTVAVPAGARIVSVGGSGDELLVLVETNGQREILVVSRVDGSLVQRISLTAQPASD